MTRVLIVANKSWEVDPLLAVLRSDYGRPPSFPAVAAPPRAVIPSLNGADRSVSARLALQVDAGIIEIWCVKDLMDPRKSSSSSEEKARVLPHVTEAGEPPVLVVAFGTASLPDQNSFNGCVAVGSNVFVHDAYGGSPNPESAWDHPAFGQIIENTDPSSNAALMTWLDRDGRTAMESRFLSSPLNPARPPIVLTSTTSVAISDVNVTNPDNYIWADRAALNQFSQVAPKASAASVETTHGVIRLAIPSPRFLFVSGIANRLGYFNAELSPRSYAQNFVASHNAGVVTAWLISRFLSELSTAAEQ